MSYLDLSRRATLLLLCWTACTVRLTGAIDNIPEAEAKFWCAEDLELGRNGKRNDPSLIFDLYLESAKAGFSPAQYRVGQAYENGNGIEKSLQRAETWYRSAAQSKNLAALDALIRLLKSANRLDEAREWSGRVERPESIPVASANPDDFVAGDPESLKAAGDNALLGLNGVAINWAAGSRWYRLAAEQGSVPAMLALANIYYSGTGIQIDCSEELIWNYQAAIHGSARGEAELGRQWEKGEGVPQDYREAHRWYRRAAIHRDVFAQFQLSRLYFEGLGLPKNLIESLAWANLAASDGAEIFRVRRSELEKLVGPNGVVFAEQRSMELLNEIENSGASVSRGGNVSGTGSFITSDGYILTAAHVVAGATSIRVLTSDGEKTAALSKIDNVADLALLKVEGRYQPLPIAKSADLSLGTEIFTLGYPNFEIQGKSLKFTRGEISSTKGYADDPHFWQISAPVQPGNSGGPLLNQAGEIVGVIECKLGAKATELTGDVPQNVGYALKNTYFAAILSPYVKIPDPPHGTVAINIPQLVQRLKGSVVLIIASSGGRP